MQTILTIQRSIGGVAPELGADIAPQADNTCTVRTSPANVVRGIGIACTGDEILAAATGSITCLATTFYVDGDYVTIDDGIGTAPVAFYFDVSGTATIPEGGIRVNISGGGAGADVAAVLEPLIEANLQITASNTDGLLTLTHQVPGGPAVAIVNGQADPLLVVSGMTTGVPALAVPLTVKMSVGGVFYTVATGTINYGQVVQVEMPAVAGPATYDVSVLLGAVNGGQSGEYSFTVFPLA